MGYVYSAMWFVIAIILVVRFRKENKAVWGIAGYFAFMGCWWLADQMITVDLLNGIYGWIFRGISAVMIAVFIAVYFHEKQKMNK